MGKIKGDKSPAALQLTTYRCYLPVLAGLGGASSAESVPKRREGDSNPRRLLTLHDFQSCTFDHSDISPNNRMNISKRLLEGKCILLFIPDGKKLKMFTDRCGLFPFIVENEAWRKKMKKFLFVLIIVLSVLMLASCATKAQAAQSDEDELSFPYIIKAYAVEGQTGEFLDIGAAYDPEKGLTWNPWYNTEEGKSCLDFVDTMAGTYDGFEDGPRPTQKFTFHALKATDAVIFGLSLKDQDKKVLTEIYVAVSIDSDLNIKILDHTTKQPEN